MNETWIVGLDGSSTATAALRWAVSNATVHDASIVAVRAWHMPMTLTAMMMKRGVDVDRLGLEATVGHEIDEVIASIGADGNAVESLAVEGHPARVLLDQASSAALLVLGRRGISELEHLILGSVTKYCATHATVPVVVVPPEWEAAPTDDIVVGFDGSPNSRRALRWALDFAVSGQRVRAVAAIDVAGWLDEETTRQRFPDEVERETSRLIDALDAVDPDRRAERDILLHSPHQALSATAATAALCVVGGRGRGRGGPKLLGSVSSWMLHESPCPIVVIPQSTAT
jgi:nucleotide-binding universal stress UspA family protein